MTISEVVALLGRVNQIAGDIPVAVKAAEGGAESLLEAVNIHIPAGSEGQPAVQLVHRAAAAPAAPPAPGDQSGIPAA